MEVEITSKKSENLCYNTRRNIPQGNYLQSRCLKNLKSQPHYVLRHININYAKITPDNANVIGICTTENIAYK